MLQTFLKAAKFMRPKETGSTRRVFVSVPSYEEEAWRYFGVDDADRFIRASMLLNSA